MINGIITKLAAIITTALPAYSRVDTFFTALPDGGDFPMAMVYDPAVKSTRLRERQTEETLTVSAQLLRAPDQATEMRDDLDAVVAAIDADPTLTASALDVLVVDRGALEGIESRTPGGLVIEVKVVA